jgi:hypothetical protein
MSPLVLLPSAASVNTDRGHFFAARQEDWSAPPQYEFQATDLLATLPACNGRRHNQLCRLSHECKLGDQPKDDADKEPREERSCGRSQTSLYNRTRRHFAFRDISPIEMEPRELNPSIFWGRSPRRSDQALRLERWVSHQQGQTDLMVSRI